MRRRRPFVAPVIAVCVAVLILGMATGCDGDGSAGRSRSGAEYVALGDSYTAAPGIGATDAPLCGRADGNYPTIVADELDLELDDVSCGSATTDDVENSQQVKGKAVPPQIRALGDETELVTMSLGGNDAATIPILSKCIQIARATDVGAPCADSYGNETERAKKFDDVRSDLIDNLVGAIGAVEKAAPKARILLVGYPQFLPTDAGCQQFPIADGDASFIHRLNLTLNDALRAAAESTEVEYVDVYAATVGHDFCASDPWVAGVRPTAPAAAFHPYAEEQRAAADAIIEVVRGK